MSFFAALYLLALQKNRLMTAGLLLGLLFQLHYFTIALVGAWLVTFLKQRPKKYIQAISFWLAFILPNLTFVIFDLTHEGFYRKILWESFFGDSSQKFIVFDWQNLLLGPLQYLSDVNAKLLGVTWWMGLALGLSWLIYAYQKLKNGQDEERQLIYSWMFFLLLTSLFPTLLNDYHSAVLWPSLALSLVWLITKLAKKKSFYVVLVALTTWLFVANRIWREPTLEENMPRLREIGQNIAKDALANQETAVNVASLVDPDARATRFRYFVIQAGQELMAFDQYPHSQVLYLISQNSFAESMKNPAWELETFKEASANQIWSDGEWQVWKAKK